MLPGGTIMIDNRVSTRRYLKAMVAATDRSECLGLIVVVGRPSEVGRTWPGEDGLLLRDVLGPYLGLVRAVPADHEGAGVDLPEGIRVVAEGLDAHHWPGSEAAFRDELGTPAPEHWSRSLHRWDRAWRADVARRANTEISWYFGVESRIAPAIVVLDPGVRRGVVLGLRRGTAIRPFCERLVAELGGWPRRRLAVVESLVEAHLELARIRRPHSRTVVGLRATSVADADRGSDHDRAVLLARHFDLLNRDDLLTPTAAGPSRPTGEIEDDRRTELVDRITSLRTELDRSDQAMTTASAAVRAAHLELGDLRSTEFVAPDTFVGWHFERLRTPRTLRRAARR